MTTCPWNQLCLLQNFLLILRVCTFLYCHIRSWRQIYGRFQKFSGAPPPRSLHLLLLSDLFQRANSVFLGASPLNCLYSAPSSIVRFVPGGKFSKNYKNFRGLRPLRICTFYLFIRFVPGGEFMSNFKNFRGLRPLEAAPSSIFRFVPGGKICSWNFQIFGGFAP